MSIRTDVISLLDSFLAGWATGNMEQLARAFHTSGTLRSSAHGTTQGIGRISRLLVADQGGAMPMELISTNHYVAGNDKHTVFTAYVFGHLDNVPTETPAYFGAVIAADAIRGPEGWSISDMKLAIPWTDGDSARFKGWNVLSAQGWTVGDPTPVIVSELDSPWARGIPALQETDSRQRIADAYARYSWAIDQGDIHLLRGCYTEDASGEFPPMGHREGRHEIIGQQKEFRRQWAWMQHYGRVLDITLAPDGQTASMTIGRVIPQKHQTADGLELYGAHYRLRLRHEHGLWSISHFDYRPGWLTAG